jgi:3-deoxy-D-manno-octulosonate 8-phosphate phosphatase (KDO 8-P phosphatase)
MTDAAKLYSELGGRFISPPHELKQKLDGIKAIVLDWDGVFNDGYKSSSGGSPFSEVDSMGLNLLRFSRFIRTNQLPVTVLISGETNDSAFFYGERENFHYCYYKVAHKLHALDHLCEKEGLEPSHVAYFFDDVLDIPIAARCGLRIMVNQGANPLFTEYAVRHNLADYITASRGGRFAVRESCELLIALSGDYDTVLEARVENAESYQRYITARRKTKPRFFTLRDSIMEADPRQQQ